MENTNGWAAEELADVDLGDARLNGADQQIDRRRACAPQGDFAESALLTGASPATRRMYPRHCPDAKRPGNKVFYSFSALSKIINSLIQSV
jgi:hypothetical protein